MDGDSSSAAARPSPPDEQQQPLLRDAHPAAAGSTHVSATPDRAAGGRNSHSSLVRRTAARQLEERRALWAYSPFAVAVAISWSLTITIACAILLAVTAGERPNVPARVWVAVYGVLCVVRTAIVWAEYKRRVAERRAGADSEGGNRRSSFARRCESLSTVASFMWWMIGFYWLISGGDVLLQDAPKLYWWIVELLAFDVFFAIVFVVLACVIGIALCFCLPSIIAILYAIAGQVGASDSDISILPRYRYAEEVSAEGTMIPISNFGGSSSEERILLREDAECCVCLTSYEDGTELQSLPCNHHFHSACIVKWLKIHATCPLCKHNILKGNDRV